MPSGVSDQLAAVYETIPCVDVTLAAFGHATEATTYPRRRRPLMLFRNGELVRFLFGRLRSHPHQTSAELRDAIIESKNLDHADVYIRQLIHKKVCIALNRQEKRGTVVRDGEAWRVA